MSSAPRFLIIQLFSNGDCLYATAVARQIKNDFPDCHLTWAISSRCKQILIGNPHVDAIWEIGLDAGRDIKDQWQEAFNAVDRVKAEAADRQRRGEFDQVFATQFTPARWDRYDGTARGFILQAFPYRLTVPLAPVVHLTEPEVERVNSFVGTHPIISRSRAVILFETSPKSSQSFVTPEWALEVSRGILERHQDVAVVLSSDLPVATGDERLIDGSVLSLRENAELTKHCSLFVGCSSGISWLCTSEWAKPLPMLQLLTEASGMPNSLVYDHARHGLPTEHIIELVDCAAERAIECVSQALTRGFANARKNFNQPISMTRSYAFAFAQTSRQRRDLAGLAFVWRALRRDGLDFELLTHITRSYGRRLAARIRRSTSMGSDASN